MASLQEYIDDLPKKEFTNIGEGGAKISGGQRQRIAIARAIYRNCEVLVLDEATSALDYETEKLIMDNILQRTNKITVIAVAHRLSTLERCTTRVEFRSNSEPVVVYVTADGEI